MARSRTAATVQADPRPPEQPGLFNAPVPDSIEEEARGSTVALAAAGGREVPAHLAPTLTSLLLLEEPGRILQIIEAREKLMSALQAVAIKSTNAQDWTGFKDKDGREVFVLRDSGAVKIRKWMGISIFNHRPRVGDVAEPKITTEKIEEMIWKKNPEGRNERVGSGKMVDVLVAEMWADGRCELTGETVNDVYVGLRTVDGFVGRGHRQDLIASCRTSLDTKVVRVLSSLRKVSVELLQAAGIDPRKAYQGSGYGTSGDREKGRVADAGAQAGAADLWREILKRTAGDDAASVSLLKDVTYWKKGDKDGWARKWQDLTQDWQVENAMKALRAHSVFGDRKTLNGARDAGEEG